MSMQTTSENAAGEPMIDMNVTPLIDVMLVLLIMFIITIPVQTHAVKLDLPVNQPQRRCVYGRLEGDRNWRGETNGEEDPAGADSPAAGRRVEDVLVRVFPALRVCRPAAQSDRGRPRRPGRPDRVGAALRRGRHLGRAVAPERRVRRLDGEGEPRLRVRPDAHLARPRPRPGACRRRLRSTGASAGRRASHQKARTKKSA